MHPVAHSPYGMATLQQRQHWHSFLYEIRRRDGGVRRFTTADGITDFRGQLFYPEPGEARDVEIPAGFGAGDTECRGFVGSGVNQVTGPDIDAGRYADALIIQRRIDRRGSKLLVEQHFFVEDIDHDGRVWAATMLTLARELRQNRGPVHHNVCDAVLGDGLCQAVVSEESVTVSAISSNDPKMEFTVTGHTATAQLYYLGRIKWLTGNNAGTEQRVYGNTAAGVIQLGVEPRYNVLVGDTAKLRKGCDGQWTTCKNVHNNLPNHRGNQFSRSLKDLILARGTVN